MLDSIKQKQHDKAVSSPTHTHHVSTVDHPTSGIDLPVEFSASEDFGQGYIDVEMPLKSGFDDSLDLDKTAMSLPIVVDAPSPVRESNPKTSTLPASAPPTMNMPEVVDIKIDVPDDSFTELKSHQISRSVEALPEGKSTTRFPSHKPSASRDSTNTSLINAIRPQSKSPAPSAIAPASPVSIESKVSAKLDALPRLYQLSRQDLPTLHNSLVMAPASITDLSSLHASKQDSASDLPKIPPAFALPRKIAAVTPAEVQITTPLRLASKRTLLERPSIKTRSTHQHHVTFSPLAQLAPQSVGTNTGRRSVGVYVHKPRDDHNPVVALPQQETGDMKEGIEIREIVQILQDIQEVIISKISGRFDGVRREVRLGRDNILRAAAANIDKMRAESAEHFNTMVDLEAEYASFRRYGVESLEDLCSIDDYIVNRLGEIIQHHDRHGLAKKFPKTLPAIPACFQTSKVKSD
ncbi:hypothetical protein GYMLUDRAFT_651650 [Collybiopsis luxurians FD-317 M1]|uniref:Uncharacterized protein n=1 Tax=Collybiopsis luxurians FD-317 M1 TaxID=944289 RepID=A0A0D0B822_9AGAR|nr:hypothetical protein GYMLUDRAFT_651650 [Collybiopsis luxurians FD-317 M1]